jgi:hypothetical protein
MIISFEEAKGAAFAPDDEVPPPGALEPPGTSSATSAYRMVSPQQQALLDRKADLLTGGVRNKGGFINYDPNEFGPGLASPESRQSDLLEIERELKRPNLYPGQREALEQARQVALAAPTGAPGEAAPTKRRTISFEEAQGKPALDDEVPSQPGQKFKKFSDVFPGTTMGQLKQGLGAKINDYLTGVDRRSNQARDSVATVLDMTAGLFHQAVSAMGETAYLYGADKNLSRKEREAKGQEVREDILKEAPTWFTDLVTRNLPPGQEPKMSDIAEGMDYVTQQFKETGKIVDKATGGVISEENVGYLLNWAMVGLSALPGLNKLNKPTAGQKVFTQGTQPKDTFRTTGPPAFEAKGPIKSDRLPWQMPDDIYEVPPGERGPPPPPAGTANAAAAATAEATGEAAPAARTPTATEELAPDSGRPREEMMTEARQKFPDDTQWAKYLEDYAAAEAKHVAELKASAAAEAPKAADLLAEAEAPKPVKPPRVKKEKAPQGKTNEQLMEEIAKESGGPPATDLMQRIKDSLKAPYKDSTAKKAMLLGGTGAALAYGYAGDHEQDAPLAAIAAGMVIARERVQIAKLPADSPMARVLGETRSTLKVLEEVPGNWASVPQKWLRDQLKRQDVTKAERDLFEDVLVKHGDAERIPSRDLVMDLKGAMGEFELRPEISAEYADYGLDNIGRIDKDLYENDLGRLGQDNPIGQLPDVKSQTIIWQLPREATYDPHSNHFGDPNYFAHTRRFEQDGIKHVIELQSDLAQRNVTPLTRSAREALQSELYEVDTRYGHLNSALEKLRDFRYADISETVSPMARFKGGIRSLEKVIDLAPGTLAERYVEKIDSALATGDSYNRPHENSPSALREWRDKFILENRGEQPILFDGLRYLIAKDKIRWPEAKEHAKAIDNHFSQLREELRLKKTEIETKLAGAKDIEYLDPMMKNWHKRLIREELADSARKVEADRERLEKIIKGREEYQRERGFTAETGMAQETAEMRSKLADEPRIVRFASADTVAKVEHWTEEVGNVKKDVAYYDRQIAEKNELLKAQKEDLEAAKKAYAAFRERMAGLGDFARLSRDEQTFREMAQGTGMREERVRYTEATIKGLEADRAAKIERLESGALAQELFSTWEKRQRRSDLWDQNGEQKSPEEMAASEEKLARKIASTKAIYEKQAKAGKIFSNPDHAGIYERYKSEVEKFLKQLGGKEYTDPQGHTWFEVPYKPGGGGKRAQMFGGADLRTFAGLAALGFGAVIGTHMASKDNKLVGAILGGAAGAFIGIGGIPAAFRVAGKFARADQRFRINELTERREYNLKSAALATWRTQNEIYKLVPKVERREAIHTALEQGQIGTLAGDELRAARIAQGYYSAISVLSAQGQANIGRLHSADVASVVGVYGNAVTQNIANKMFLTELKAQKLPNGQDIVMSNKAAPPTYVPIENPLLQGNRYHPDIAPSLKFMFEAQEPGAAMAAIGTFNTAIKRSAVSLSLFHAKSLADAALGAFRNPAVVGKVVGQSVAPWLLGENRFLKQLKQGAGGLPDEAIRDGLVFSPERMDPASEDIGGGFYRNMEKVQHWLDGKAPGFGLPIKGILKVNHAMDNFMWGRLHAAFKLEVYAAKREALMENNARAGNPITQAEAGKIAAAYANDVFGGLNWQRLAEGSKTRWGRDIALAAASPSGRRASQLLLFAPDWTLSTSRAAYKAVSDHPTTALKNLGSAKNLGDLHRQQLLRGAFFYLVIGDAINYYNTGRHLWDAKQKDWTRVELSDGRTMQLSKHFAEPFHWLMHPQQQALNKLGYIPKEGFSQATSQEYLSAKGRVRPMEPGAMGHLKHALSSMSPIGVQQFRDSGFTGGISGALGVPIYGKTETEMRDRKLQQALDRYYKRLEEMKSGK